MNPVPPPSPEEYRNTCYVQKKRLGQSFANFLCYDVMRGSQHIYTIPLMIVHGSEENLNGGRFENFVRHEQEHNVTLNMSGADGEKFRKDFRERVEWIAEQTAEPWTFLPEPHAVGKMDMTFSFASLVTAVVFKLVWY